MIPPSSAEARKVAEAIIARWRPYMKLFGPSKGFPKNKVSMLQDIAYEIDKAVLKERERIAKWVEGLQGNP